MRKHAQMEMMGLAIIVILLSMALLFIVRFVFMRQETDISREYTESSLAANFLNTLQEINSPDCSDIKFSTLFQDCANNLALGGKIPCGSKYSCEYLYEKTQMILDSTFGKWNEPYYFIASTDVSDDISAFDTKIFDPIGSPCPGDRKGKQQPLPLGNGDNVFLVLYICEE